MLEKIIEDLTLKQKQTILYDIEHVKDNLIGLSCKYDLDIKIIIGKFNYLFNTFTEKNLEKHDAYYSVIEALYSSEKLMKRYIDKNK